MDGIELFEHCLAQATTVVKQVRDEQFTNSTPNTEWNVRDLLGHMLYELSWVPDLLAGKTIDDVGDKYEDDLIGDDAVELSANWQAAVDAAELALADCDPDETAHLSYGDVTIDEYLNQVGGDLLIHGWDLGKSIGMPVKFSTSLATSVYENALPRKDEIQASGLFGPALPTADTADVQTRLLALFGRRADWAV